MRPRLDQPHHSPLDWARVYHACGFFPFRLAAGSKVPPAGSRGHLGAARSLYEVERDFDGWTGNVGMTFPPELFAVDIDPQGLALAATLGLPATAKQRTPRGGLHLLYRGVGARQGVGILGPGIDTRTERGYIVTEPSATPAGSYRWEVTPRADSVADAPDWLMERLREGNGEARFRRHIQPDGFEVAPVHEGGRNDFLASALGHLLRRDVAAELLPALVHGLNRERCAPPLARGEVDIIVHSIIWRELTRRGAAE